MTKVKITVEIDVDFQKFFDDIPEDPYTSDEDEEDESVADDDYALQCVWGVLSDSYVDRLMNEMDWMADKNKDLYPYIKHHLKASIEVARQIKENAKVKILKPKKI